MQENENISMKSVLTISLEAQEVNVPEIENIDI